MLCLGNEDTLLKLRQRNTPGKIPLSQTQRAYPPGLTQEESE